MSLLLGDQIRDTVLIKINFPKCKEVKTKTCSTCSNVQACYCAVSKARYHTVDREIRDFLSERQRAGRN